MKKLLFASLALATAYSSAYGQAQRRVLFEEFTQASCGPCASQNPAYNTLLSGVSNVPKLVSLKYQVSWPGYDPMYEQNPAMVDDRVSYYGVSAVPNVFMDGNIRSKVAPSTITQTVVDNQYAVTSPIEIHLTHNWNAYADSVMITAKIKNVSANAYGSATHRLHVALVEEEINFATAPGSNGETDFYGVVREMYPSVDGATFPTIPAGDSITVTYNVAVPAFIYNLEKIATAAFIQDNSNKHVDNAQWSDPVPLPANLALVDLSASAATANLAGLCAYDLTPAIQLTNAAAVALESFKAYYSINGGTPVQQDVTGISVANGQNHTVTFPMVTLPEGSTALVSYWVNSFNYANAPVVDPNLSDNAIEDDRFVTLSTASVGTTVQEGFSGYTSYTTNAPTNAVLRSNSPEYFYILDGNDIGRPTLGGFGTSSEVYRFNYFASSAGTIGELIFDKLDFSAFTAPTLTFSHAYAQYSSENDRLQVLVSTDCGATWSTPLFNKAGTALKTAPATTNTFYPTSTQWAANTVSLAAYAGMTDVIVAFKGTSAYGNMLYVDDINIQEVMVGTEQVAKAENSLNLFPNPVRTELNVAFNMVETTELNITIYNALGQSIRTVANGAFNGENMVTVNTADLAAGVYHLNLVSDKGVMTQRFVVEK